MRGLRDKENIVYWKNLLFPLSVGIYPPIDFLRYAFSTNLVSCCAFQFFFFFKASRNVFNINFSALVYVWGLNLVRKTLNMLSLFLGVN